MIKFDSVSDFEKYGINALTGEACAYANRLLCDVSDKGKALLELYFGVSITFPANWNSRVKDEPATGSIMLPREWRFWRALALFILWHIEKCDYAFEEGGLCGIRKDDEYCEQYLKLYKDTIWRNPNLNQPQVNGRNVHAMSGRTT